MIIDWGIRQSKKKSVCTLNVCDILAILVSRPCKLAIISADATPVYFANMLIDVWTFSVSRCYHEGGPNS